MKHVLNLSEKHDDKEQIRTVT